MYTFYHVSTKYSTMLSVFKLFVNKSIIKLKKALIDEGFM